MYIYIQERYRFITFYYLSALTSSIVNRQYYFYNVDDKIEIENLLFVKTIEIENLKYFIFESRL